jgi:PAS domain S-box-containing protein
VDDVTAQPGRGQVDHPHSRPESDQAGVSDEQLTSESALVLVEASPDGLLLVDEAGIILLANQKIEEMFGYDRAELIGRPVEVLVPDRARQVHTAHRIRYRAAPQGRPMGVGLELYGRRRDGTELPVEISLSPVDTGSSLRVIACVRDVTDRHRAEARVRMLSETMDALHDAVFMFDPDSLQFSYVNDGAVLQTGYSREELLTMTPLHIAPDFTQTDFSAMLTGLLAGQVNRHGFTTVHRRKDGTDVPVEVFLEYPEPANPTQPRFLVAVVRDISERREAELERQRHERWLDALATVREAYLEDRPRAAVLPLICERGRDLVGAEGGILLLRDGDDRLTIAAVVGDVTRGSTGESIPIDASLGGEVVRTGATVSVEDVSADPRATGPIAAHRGPAVFAPLAADQMVLGVLVIVASFDRGPFTPVEVATIESFAAQAAIAMVLGQARADRARLSILEDRERIAADLHDRVIQRLFATGMSLQATAGRIGDHAVAPRIDAAVRELDETITELRSAIFRLSERPEDAPFTDRIRAVVARAAPPGLDPAVHLVGDVDGLRPAVFEQLVPTIEEALSNVTRHAGASEVTVELVVDAVDARLSVCDDGVGIAPDAVPGTGLKSLRARAERLGGTCHIDTEPGAGTTITWRVPL